MRLLLALLIVLQTSTLLADTWRIYVAPSSKTCQNDDNRPGPDHCINFFRASDFRHSVRVIDAHVSRVCNLGFRLTNSSSAAVIRVESQDGTHPWMQGNRAAYLDHAQGYSPTIWVNEGQDPDGDGDWDDFIETQDQLNKVINHEIGHHRRIFGPTHSLLMDRIWGDRNMSRAMREVRILQQEFGAPRTINVNVTSWSLSQPQAPATLTVDYDVDQFVDQHVKILVGGREVASQPRGVIFSDTISASGLGAGTHRVELRATTYSGTGSDAFTVTVAPPPSPPQLIMGPPSVSGSTFSVGYEVDRDATIEHWMDGAKSQDDRTVDAGRQYAFRVRDLDEGDHTAKLVARGTSGRDEWTHSFSIGPPPEPGDGWHNEDMPADVDRSGTIEPVDVLLVINKGNELGWGAALPQHTAGEPAVDVNDDGRVTPEDVLLVIREF